VQRYIRIDCFKNLIKILVYFIAYREIKSMAWVMVKVNRNDNAVGLTSILDRRQYYRPTGGTKPRYRNVSCRQFGLRIHLADDSR